MVTDRVDEHRANGNVFGGMTDAFERVGEQAWTESVALAATIDGKASQDHDRDGEVA